jgi:hypothetical protein
MLTSASSNMVNSPGFPKLNGPICSPSINRIRPSTYTPNPHPKLSSPLQFFAVQCGWPSYKGSFRAHNGHKHLSKQTWLNSSEPILS